MVSFLVFLLVTFFISVLAYTEISAQEADPNPLDHADTLSNYLRESLSHCQEIHEQSVSKGLLLDSCQVEKAIELEQDSLCSFKFNKDFVDKLALRELMFRCLPELLFGRIKFQAFPYEVKRDIIRQIDPDKKFDSDVIAFRYAAAVCNEGDAIISGLLQVGISEASAYTLLSLPFPCTVEK